ncbi:MAG: hypothetical protein WC307_06520 [Candidatus Nanoarchaeia archaeon]|jgi:hypothetical protein
MTALSITSWELIGYTDKCKKINLTNLIDDQTASDIDAGINALEESDE